MAAPPRLAGADGLAPCRPPPGRRRSIRRHRTATS